MYIHGQRNLYLPCFGRYINPIQSNLVDKLHQPGTYIGLIVSDEFRGLPVPLDIFSIFIAKVCRM